MNQDKFVVLGGFGGQGIILAGYIVGKAATIFERKNATLIQDYGPEARGGACRAQVVISAKQIFYPYIEHPSVLVVMSQQAYNLYSPGLQKGAPLLIDKELVKTKRSTTNMVFAIPATRIARELGRVAVANIVMLGFLTAVTSVVSLKAMKKAVLDSVPKGTEELNSRAFERGYAYGLEQREASGGKGV